MIKMTLYYVLPLRFTIFESLLDISIFFLMEKQDLSLNELILRWSSAMAFDVTDVGCYLHHIVGENQGQWVPYGVHSRSVIPD
jgi:hypothetical protein